MKYLNIEYCCTCLKVCSEKDKFLSLSFSSSQRITYRKKLKSCVPEMGPEIDVDSYICKPCSIALEQAYNFRCMCLHTESKLDSVRVLQRQKDNLKDMSSIKKDLVQVLAHQESNMELLPKLNRSLSNSDSAVDLDDHKIISELGSLLSESLSGTNQATSIIRALKRPARSPSTVEPKKRRLTDDELIKIVCKRNPELDSISPQSLKCQVPLEKLTITKLPVIIPNNRLVHENNDHQQQQKNFTCNICGKVLKKKCDYHSHILRHSNIRAYKCRLCPASYFHIDSLRQHKRLKHPTDKLAQTTESNSNVDPNNKSVSNKKKIAEKELVSPQKLEFEKQLDGSNLIPRKVKFTCVYCGFKASSKPLLTEHATIHAIKGEYPCPICQKTFAVLWVLKRHVRVVHKESATKRKKKKVQPELIKSQPVTDHVPINSNSTNSVSQGCMLQKGDSKGIENNNKNIVRRKKYFCPQCNAEFCSRDHANTHTGEKPYSCNVCAKSFAASKTLRTHRLLHTKKKVDVTAEKTELKSVPTVRCCEICKQTFTDSCDATSHTCQTSSGESVYRCQICKNAYLGRNALMDHMNTHLEENN